MPRQPARNWTRAELAEVEAMYLAGYGPTDIGDKFGVSRDVIRNLVTKWGIRMTRREAMRVYKFPQKIDNIQSKLRRLHGEALAMGFRDEAQKLAAALEAMGAPRSIEERAKEKLWG